MVYVEVTDERPVDVRLNTLQIRLAESEAEVRAAQALRYRIFYDEMAARPTPKMAKLKRDFDSFDEYCDHLVVLDHARGQGPKAVIGTYRLLRREGARRRGQFYSADEYDISPLTGLPGEILELGRSCIDSAYRSRACMQLLWRGIADYVYYYDVEVMFGCGSLPGVDLDVHAPALSYLYHNHLAPANLRPTAVAERFVAMDRLPLEAIAVRETFAKLPPLIKGYLRLGGYVGDGAVVDRQFHTTDVCIIVKTNLVTEKYIKHYTREDGGRPDS
jgi:putative hemolysin